MSEMSFLEWSEASRRDPGLLEGIEDGDGFLAAGGFDLDGPLLAEAFTHYAATLPWAEAENWSNYTKTHSPVSFDDDPFAVDYNDPMTGIELLATTVPSQPADDDIPDTSPEVDGEFGTGSGRDADLDPSDGLVDTGTVDDLDAEPATVAEHADDPFAVLDAEIPDDDIPEEDLAEDLGLVTDEGDDIGGGFDA